MVNLPLQQVHCGCIVSSHAFTLLDPGGIECMTCARKNVPWVWFYLAFHSCILLYAFFLLLFVVPLFDFGQLFASEFLPIYY